MKSRFSWNPLDVTISNSKKSKSFNLKSVLKELDEATTKLPHASFKSVINEALEVRSSFTPDQRKAIWQAFDKSATSTEPGFKRICAKIANDQENRVLQVLKTKIKTKAVDDDDGLDDCFDDKAVAKMFTPAWEASMVAGYSIARGVLNDPATPDAKFMNPLFLQKIKQFGLDKAKGIDDTTKADIRKAIADGIEAGEGLSLIKTRVTEAFDALREDGYRAEKIARTESMSSTNAGSLLTYAKSGVEKKEFMSALDDRTRDSHAEANGQVVPMDEPFSVGGEDMMYPGDPSCSADNVVNCRCGILPYLENQ